MGFFEKLGETLKKSMRELNEYESRGLDVLTNTPEIHKFCLKKLRLRMMLNFIRPCIFSLLLLIGAAAVRIMRMSYGIKLGDEVLKGYIITIAVALGISLLSYVLFFEGYSSLKAGKYELYGGMALHRESHGNFYQLKMNGVYLEVNHNAYDSVNRGYYYILRVTGKKKPMYFFVCTDPTVANQRTGDVYLMDP